MFFMRIRTLCRDFRWVGLALALAIVAAPAVRAASDGAGAREGQREGQAAQFENLLGELLGSNLATPEYTDHGGGLHSLFVPLDSAQRERLSSLLRGGDRDKAIAYYFLAGGQQLTPPTNPAALVHAALSNTTLRYNYWVVVVNLGQDVTRNTTFKLTGPGRTFSRTFSLLYRANGIWTYWFSAPGVGTPGFYHYTPTVAGAGTFAIHTAAVNP